MYKAEKEKKDIFGFSALALKKKAKLHDTTMVKSFK